uniref:Fibronectin type-III domain-containing protein n=1 Tax=Schistocephalus solidus TaxID=70667 RepID=A0A0X3P2Q0_SCHSO
MWKPFILCWLLSVLGPSHQGFVGKRHRGPSFEVTERTDTCIDVQWDKHYFKTTGLRLFILRGISMFDKKSVEYRFAAVARDGYLCELEPNTKYTISLIPVTISGTTPETFDLHNVLTLPAVARLAVSNLQNSVDNSAEVEIADSTEGTDEVSTEGRKTATLSNYPSLSETITGAIPTVPSESNEKITSQTINGLRHSVDKSAEGEIADSKKGTDEAASAESETETSSNTPNHLETITGARPRYQSASNEKVASLAISNPGESVDNSAEAEITDSTKGKDWVSTEGHGTETLANYSTHSKTITGGSTRVNSQSDEKVHLGAFRQEGFPPAALVVTVCVILSLLALAIGIIIWVARRSLGRRFNFKLDLVHAEENC